MKLYCYDCGEQVAIVEKGSKIKKLTIMLCGTCNTKRYSKPKKDVFDSELYDSSSMFKDIFGGFKG